MAVAETPTTRMLAVGLARAALADMGATEGMAGRPAMLKEPLARAEQGPVEESPVAHKGGVVAVLESWGKVQTGPTLTEQDQGALEVYTAAAVGAAERPDRQVFREATGLFALSGVQDGPSHPREQQMNINL